MSKQFCPLHKAKLRKNTLDQSAFSKFAPYVIKSEIIRVISKSNERAARVQFEIALHSVKFPLYYIHFNYQWKGKPNFWEQKLQNSHKDFLCLNFIFQQFDIGFKQALKSDWLMFCFSVPFSLAGERV